MRQSPSDQALATWTNTVFLDQFIDNLSVFMGFVDNNGASSMTSLIVIIFLAHGTDKDCQIIMFTLLRWVDLEGSHFKAFIVLGLQWCPRQPEIILLARSVCVKMLQAKRNGHLMGRRMVV